MPTNGEILRRVRELREIRQLPFATAIGISPSTLYRLEHDDPRVDIDTYARAAQELSLSFDWKDKRVIPPKDLPAAALETDGEGDHRRAAVALDIITSLIDAGTISKGGDLLKQLRALAKG